MKKNLFRIAFSLLFIATALNGFAQEEEKSGNTTADLGVDVVTAYIWRGVVFDNSPNIQGWGVFGYKNFTVGGWGTVSFNGAYFEPNLFLSYTYKNLSLTITDVDGGFGQNFFNYKSDETAHILDASLVYQFPETFPLKVTGSVIFYGADKKIESYNALGEPVLGTDDNYSGYIEFAMPMAVNKTDLEFTFGMATHESIIYGTDGFGIINVGAKASKTLQITDKFALPISFALIANPDANRLFAVFTLSL